MSSSSLARAVFLKETKVHARAVLFVEGMMTLAHGAKATRGGLDGGGFVFGEEANI